MIKRENYLTRIRPFIDQTELVKVLVGVRRSGKSVLLRLIQDELRSRSVPEVNILALNFEEMAYADLTTAKALHYYLTKQIEERKGRVYLFLDEIQEVED